MRRLLAFGGKLGGARGWVAWVIALVAVAGATLAVSGASSVDADLNSARALAVTKARSLNTKHESASRKAPDALGTRKTVGPLAHDRSADNSHSAALFAAHSWYVAPPPPPPAPPPPPVAPTAPPFPYIFVGAYTSQGDGTVYFLAQGDRVIDAHVGDHLDGVYEFESATAGQLTFNYLPLNIRQLLSTGAPQ